MKSARRKRRKAAETREEILDAAERCLSDKGLDAVRLEDVAAEVGIQRAAIFYYFRDKQELSRAALSRLTGDLLARLGEAFAARGTLKARIAASVDVFVDFMAERPAFARLALRLASETQGPESDGAREFAQPLLELLARVCDEGIRAGVLEPVTRDPLHLASTLAGSSVFFEAAMPAFAPEAKRATEFRRREMRTLLERLLGLRRK